MTSGKNLHCKICQNYLSVMFFFLIGWIVFISATNFVMEKPFLTTWINEKNITFLQEKSSPENLRLYTAFYPAYNGYVLCNFIALFLCWKRFKMKTREDANVYIFIIGVVSLLISLPVWNDIEGLLATSKGWMAYYIPVYFSFISIFACILFLVIQMTLSHLINAQERK